MERPIILLVYAACAAAMSVVTAALLGWDKRQAAHGGGRRRVSEATLHLCELLGGWPGSLIARPILRHKTRKLRYRVVLGGIVLLHAAVIAAVLWYADLGPAP